jgi:mannose-6-phosphate isomerase-like protein (cupin superfamily)
MVAIATPIRPSIGFAFAAIARPPSILPRSCRDPSLSGARNQRGGTALRHCARGGNFVMTGAQERDMTGMLEHEMPGLGHNKPSPEDADEIKHGKWERWAKKRTFVRALEGTYSHLYKKLLEEPRVYSSKDHPWKGGPAMYGKHVISPSAVNVVQSIESHIECYAPLNAGQKHGHLNSAVFYVLKGHGHDVHDGRYMKWEAGDVMLVENASVHQHFNDDDRDSCILLVFKAKPLFLFMHLLFQKMVEWPTDKLPPGVTEFHPPTEI